MWVCRLPVHIAPAGCTAFTEILGEFVTSHWADRVVGPYVKALLSPYLRSGGRLCPPAGCCVFTGIYGKFATFLGRQGRRPLQLRGEMQFGFAEGIPLFAAACCSDFRAQRGEIKAHQMSCPSGGGLLR